MGYLDILSELVFVYSGLLILISYPVLSVINIKERKLVKKEMIKRNLLNKSGLY